MPKRGSGKTPKVDTADYRHPGTKRKNVPPAAIAAEGTVPYVAKARYVYSPHLPPVLRFDTTGAPDKLPELIAEAGRRPLTAAEQKLLAEGLRKQEPWLEWAGKRESDSVSGGRGRFEVDPVALHIHERISAQAILKVAARQDVQRDLFADPEQAYHEAVQFYQHDIDWTNRMILGDSLQVMSSLARREDLAGKVQMIYIDPPYGIRFGSNFQPEIGRRDVRDKAEDLTREPEMVKAYRDTWTLGIHSYLAYLRDRLWVSKELLADTGHLFLQIGEDNVHLVRQLLGEIFGVENFFLTILLKKKGGQKSGTMDPINDYILWTSKDRDKAAKKFRRLFSLASIDKEYLALFGLVELPDGQIASVSQLSAARRTDYRANPEQIFKGFPGARLFTSGDATVGGVRKNQSVLFRFHGRDFDPGLARGSCWKHTAVRQAAELSGMERLAATERLLVGNDQVRIKRYADDFGASAITNWWDEFGGAMDRVYAVQTNSNVVERCLLMCTDPGDLVLDPTCGSGTTTYVAEQWGRRWITIDTSRVAIAIARQRLITARYDYYQLRAIDEVDRRRNPSGTWLVETADPKKEPKTFDCRKVPHITSSVVANLAHLDPILAKHEPILDGKLKAANAALAKVTDSLRAKLREKLLQKQKAEGKKAVTEADRRRRELPKNWEHYEVPFDTDPDWPNDLQEAVAAYRKAWRAKMDEVNACIAANAEEEELVDEPEVVKGIVRVTGPFTVEAVQPPEISLDEQPAFGRAPEELKTGFDVATGAVEAQNARAYLRQMFTLIKMDGIRFPNNRQMQWSRLEALFESGRGDAIHAEGRWVPAGKTDEDPNRPATVGVVFGPQYGPVTAKMVEEVIRPAARRYERLVIAGFSFDGPAQAIIESKPHPRLELHLAHIRPDVNPGMAGLLKEQPGSQLFTVFGQPRIAVHRPGERGAPKGEYVVQMEGVDIYDPVTNEIQPTKADKVAAWFLDSDYDGRTFCITQAFFPDRSAWEKLSKALDSVIDPERFEAFSGTASLPFPPGKHQRIAVKVIDPRGNEVMATRTLEG